jgi:hypothetical protein
MTDNGFFDRVDALMTDTQFTTGPAIRFSKLLRMRDDMKKAPLDPDLEAALKAKLAADYPGLVMRFRTSTNVDQAVLSVVDDRPSTAIAYVEQRWANRIKIGDRAELVPRDRSGPPRVGQVTALAPSIGELPERFWHFPNVREYGRNVFIKLEAAASLPGQAFDATFRPAAGAGR